MDQERIRAECSAIADTLNKRPQHKLAVFVTRDAESKPLMQAVKSIAADEFEKACPHWQMVGVYDCRTPAESISDDVLAVLEAMA